MCAADVRNGAVGAAPVAAFGDLQVGARSPVEMPGSAQGIARMRAKGQHYRVQFTRSEPTVNLRNKGRQLSSITLRQAAKGIQLPRRPRLPSFRLLQQHLYAFFLGIAYEAAGIHQKVVHGARPVLGQHIKTVTGQLCKQMLGVHGVLGTAQGYDLDRFHFSSGASSSSAKSSEANLARSVYHSMIFFMWEA